MIWGQFSRAVLNVINATVEELMDVDGIGKSSATKIREVLDSEDIEIDVVPSGSGFKERREDQRSTSRNFPLCSNLIYFMRLSGNMAWNKNGKKPKT